MLAPCSLYIPTCCLGSRASSSGLVGIPRARPGPHSGADGAHSRTLLLPPASPDSPLRWGPGLCVSPSLPSRRQCPLSFSPSCLDASARSPQGPWILQLPDPLNHLPRTPAAPRADRCTGEVRGCVPSAVTGRGARGRSLLHSRNPG